MIITFGFHVGPKMVLTSGFIFLKDVCVCMSVTKKLKQKLGLDDGMPDELSRDVGSLGMARIVFNDDEYRLKIRKTFQTQIDEDGKFLIPADVRKDTTGREHLTNDIQKQQYYKMGLLLAEPSTVYTSTFRRYFTVKFVGYVTADGYVTIPKELREAYEIEEYDTVQVAVAQRIFDVEENKSYSPDYSIIPDREDLEIKF